MLAIAFAAQNGPIFAIAIVAVVVAMIVAIALIVAHRRTKSVGVSNCSSARA